MGTNQPLEPRAVAALGILLVAAVGAANAQSPPKEGRYSYMACYSATTSAIAFSKTHSAISFEEIGAVHSATPGDLFDNNTFRCVGMSATFDGKTTAAVTCESVDKDGDKRLSHFTIADGKTVRQQVAGTGKFDGMTMETTEVKSFGVFPPIKPGTFQGCNLQTGTYKLR